MVKATADSAVILRVRRAQDTIVLPDGVARLIYIKRIMTI